MSGQPRPERQWKCRKQEFGNERLKKPKIDKSRLITKDKKPKIDKSRLITKDKKPKIDKSRLITKDWEPITDWAPQPNDLIQET